MSTQIDVALFLWNPDVIELVSMILLRRNLQSCGVEPSKEIASIEACIAAWSPSVVVFDLAPPYDRSAAGALRLVRRFPDRPFVMTCADKGLALRRAPWLAGHVMFQKPCEVNDVANAVRSLVRRSSRLDALSVGAS